MTGNDKPILNPMAVLREEFDDWAILFDPDSGKGFGIDPVGVFVCKRLDGQHAINEIVTELRQNCENVPDEAEEHAKEFVQSLAEWGLVGYQMGQPVN